MIKELQVPTWTQEKIETHVVLIDNNGNKTRKIYQMQTTSFGQAETDALVIIAALSDATKLDFVQYDVRVVYSNEWSYPGADAQKEERAVIIGTDSENPLKDHSFEIPTPIDDVFLETSGEGSLVVDVTNSEVLAYYDLFIETGVAYISDGENLEDDGIQRGRKRSVKNDRG